MMRQVLFALSFLCLAGTSFAQSGYVIPHQDSCYTDSIPVISNVTDWKIVSNSIGYPSSVSATEISYQYNNFPDFPDARWISCMTGWLTYKSVTDPDDSIHYRYNFRVCKKDSVQLHFTVRRDNYCVVRLDGEILLKDPAADPMVNYDLGAEINIKRELDICEHQLDIVVYNRHSFTGGNGFGMIMAGYMKSDHGSFVKKKSDCSGAACCVVTSAPELNKAQARIYPNPASDEIFIDMPGGSEDVIYSVHDITGRELSRGTGGRVGLEHMAPGMYLLRIGNTGMVYRLQKQ